MRSSPTSATLQEVGLGGLLSGDEVVHLPCDCWWVLLCVGFFFFSCLFNVYVCVCARVYFPSISGHSDIYFSFSKLLSLLCGEKDPSIEMAEL